MNILDKGKAFINKNSSTILTVTGIVSAGLAVVSGIASTPKALNHIYEKKKELEYNPDDKLPVKEVIKVTWKDYIPAAGLFVSSATCIICSHKIDTKRNAALATAYAVTENSFKRYRRSVIDTIGENKEKEVREEAAKKSVENDANETPSLIIAAGGDCMCKDVVSGRYFTSDMETIKEVVNKLNRRMTYENYVSLDDYYEEIGLPQIGIGETLGWKIDDGLIEPVFGAVLSEKGKPVIAIDFTVWPREDYNVCY